MNLPTLLCGAIGIGAVVYILDSGALSPTSQSSLTVVELGVVDLGAGPVELTNLGLPDASSLCATDQGARPCVDWAAEQMAARFDGADARCVITDRNSNSNRNVMACTVEDQDLSAYMIAAGWALSPWPNHPRLYPLQQQAQAEGRGLWAFEGFSG